MTTSNSISENAISFYASGGHAHDGVTSSLIKTNSYSIYDFNPSFIGDNPERRRAQVNNYNSFRQLVVNTINSTVLEPAGIVLQDNIINSRNIISGSITATEIAANTITADNIAAGAITANQIAANTITANQIAAGAVTASELASNIVLVNNYITSNNFNGTIAANGAVTAAGNTGWAITSFGHAVFDTTFIRGSLSASEVLTPGVDIYSNGTLAANAFTLYGNGAIVAANGNFSVNASGIMSATGASISGSVTATTGQIAGWTIDGNNLTAGGFPGYITIGPTAYSLTGEAGMQIAYGSYATNLISGNFLLEGDGNLIDFTTSSPVQITISDGAQSTILSAFGVTGGNITSLGELQGDYVNIQGNGVYYNASNLAFTQTQGIFPISFSYRISGGRYYLIANNDNTTLGTINWTPSDRRIKENISPVSSDILNKFYSINVYEFNWNDKAPSFLDRNLINVGVVADELITIIPDAVDDFGSDGDEPNRWATVEYEKIVPYAIAAIQDLNSKIQILEARIAEIEA